MPDPAVICRRCGTQNEPGDQFCANCGVFLEWEGEADADGPPAATDPTAAGVAEARPPTTVAPPPLAADEPAVTCPACGTANPVGRTFCRSCGNSLKAGRAGRTDKPGQAATGAATAPGAPPTTAAGTRPTIAPDAGERKLPGWIPVIAIAGLVVGVAIVVGAVVLRPEAPLPQASAGATPTLTPTSGPGSGQPPTLRPDLLQPTGATASSIVGNRPDFAPTKAIDGDPTTAWQEGAEDEAGQWIEVTFAPSTVKAIGIRGGYQLSDDAFRGNLRPREVLVTIGTAEPVPVELRDGFAEQRLEFGGVDADRVRIEIVSTWPAEATPYPGSPFDDLAISEIAIYGEPSA